MQKRIKELERILKVRVHKK